MRLVPLWLRYLDSAPLGARGLIMEVKLWSEIVDGPAADSDVIDVTTVRLPRMSIS